jgi:hypothetical protein
MISSLCRNQRSVSSILISFLFLTCFQTIAFSQHGGDEKDCSFASVPPTRKSETYVTTIDEEGKTLCIAGARIFPSDLAVSAKEQVGFQIEQRALPHEMLDDPFELRFFQIDVYAKNKLTTIFKGICRVPKRASGYSTSKQNFQPTTYVTTIKENGEILTIAGAKLSPGKGELSDGDGVSVQVKAIDCNTEKIGTSFETRSITIDIIAMKKLTRIFNGLCLVPISETPASSAIVHQDPQNNSESEEQQTKEYAEMNRLVGDERTIFNAPKQGSSTGNFPSVADHSVYYNLFQDQNFAKEMDIIPEQQSRIDSAIRKVVDKLNPLRAQFESIDSANEKAALSNRAKDLIGELDKEYKEILSPQWNLLNQRLIAMHLKRDGFFQLVVNSGLYSKLDLPESQRAEIFQVLSRISDNTTKQLEQMHQDALQKIENSFSKEQREKILSLAGSKDLKELLPRDFSRLYGQIIQARAELSRDEALQRAVKEANH